MDLHCATDLLYVLVCYTLVGLWDRLLLTDVLHKFFFGKCIQRTRVELWLLSGSSGDTYGGVLKKLYGGGGLGCGVSTANSYRQLIAPSEEQSRQRLTLTLPHKP